MTNPLHVRLRGVRVFMRDHETLRCDHQCFIFFYITAGKDERGDIIVESSVLNYVFDTEIFGVL